MLSEVSRQCEDIDSRNMKGGFEKTQSGQTDWKEEEDYLSATDSESEWTEEMEKRTKV